MSTEIAGLDDGELTRLIDGLRRGTIAPDAGPLQLSRAGLADRSGRIAVCLAEAFAVFGTADALLAALRLLEADRRRVDRISSPIDVVMTGPGLAVDPARDTMVVIREILESARHSALIVGYAFHDCAAVFEPLARRMGRDASFRTRIVLNIHPGRDLSPDRAIARSADEFATVLWPFRPRPEVYYLPDSLHRQATHRASVHAKLAVVDGKILYIGSANFTSAALRRNIEVGVRFQDPRLGQELLDHFDRLISSGILIGLRLDDVGET